MTSSPVSSWSPSPVPFSAGGPNSSFTRFSPVIDIASFQKPPHPSKTNLSLFVEKLWSNGKRNRLRGYLRSLLAHLAIGLFCSLIWSMEMSSKSKADLKIVFNFQ